MSTTKQYASGTYVGIGRSKDEIGAELTRMGATKRMFYDDDEQHQAKVVFERKGVRYCITMPLRRPDDTRFYQTPTGRQTRSAAQAHAAWIQDCTERWRALALYVKALRVTAEAGVLTEETLLTPHAVTPSGETVAEWTARELPRALAAGGPLPPLLPEPNRGATRVALDAEVVQ